MKKITVKELLNNDSIRISNVEVRKVIKKKDVLNYNVSVVGDWSLKNEFNDASYLYEVRVVYFDYENYEGGIATSVLEDESDAKYITTRIMVKNLKERKI